MIIARREEAPSGIAPDRSAVCETVSDSCHVKRR